MEIFVCYYILVLPSSITISSPLYSTPPPHTFPAIPRLFSLHYIWYMLSIIRPKMQQKWGNWNFLQVIYTNDGEELKTCKYS